MPNFMIDLEHSSIEFKIKHLMISSVKGSFEKFQGGMSSSDRDFKDAKLWCEIDVNSINTHIRERDEHLKSEDFFDAKQYPMIRFESTEIKEGEFKNDLEVQGLLTIKDITKEVTLFMVYNGSDIDNHGVQKFGFDIDGKLLRTKWFLDFNIPGGRNTLLIGNEVLFDISIQVSQCNN